MDLLQAMKELKESQKEMTEKINIVSEAIEQNQQQIERDIESAIDKILFGKINKEYLKPFLKEPYVILPAKKQNEYYVVVPKIFNVVLGWLERSTPSYNIFLVNKYMSWLSEIPQQLREKFRFESKVPARLIDGMLWVGEDRQDEAWNRYKKHLTRREGKDRLRVKKGHEFDLVAALVRDGTLPFEPQPLDKKDIRTPDRTKYPDWLKDKMNLEYWRKAEKKFNEVGAVGIFWIFGTGKSFFGMDQCNRIKGNKLVVVDTRTLVEQWAERFREYTSIYDEVEIVTYHSFHKVKNREWDLIVFDEIHRLPANTFSRFGTLKTKYRIGLSGSPHREDGREDLIFALSGFPISMDIQYLLERGIIKEPDIVLYIVRDLKEKNKKIMELLVEVPIKTLVFCDSIDKGKRLSRMFGVPFIFGKTKNRMDIIRESDICIVSRVADAGVDIRNIKRVIEYDFLFGSRMQEAQRLGRVLHGKGKGKHIILMTENEFEKYHKRLLAIYERGFKIDVIR